MKSKKVFVSIFLVITYVWFQQAVNFAQEIPVYLQDRGSGIPTSQFGTYINKGEFLIYPFYEYYSDSDLEYEPAEFGFGSITEYRGRYHANEGILFIAYGISDRLTLEFEAAIISARLTKSPNDNSALANEIRESGLSDVEGQIRWRWNFENEFTPEFFNYFEYVLPTGEKNSLIGTSDWELKFGTGVVKGFDLGTVTLRFAIDYSAAEKNVGLGEYAIEYLKRLSDNFRIFLMLEGSEDEISVIPEIQWHLSKSVFFKLNTGLGITSKATDITPEVGVMISLVP
jgi:hypothetical protein